MEELDESQLPQNCPMKTSKEVIESATEKYAQANVKEIYVPATITEKEAYETVRGIMMAVRPRIRELIEFCKLTTRKKIGVAFCSGLRDEARRVVEILEKAGFNVASVMCKCGGIDKTNLHIHKRYKIGDPLKFEPGCNPVLQAELLSNAETDVNVIIGLCVGHDMLFTMNSKAPVTTLVVKDRLLGHNPVAVLYSNYHKNVIESPEKDMKSYRELEGKVD